MSTGWKPKAARRNEAVRLLNWGLKSFKEFKLFDAGEVVGTARVWGGSSRFVELTGKGDVRILLPRSTNREADLGRDRLYRAALSAH